MITVFKLHTGTSRRTHKLNLNNTINNLCALILSETLALYKSFTYLLTYLQSQMEISALRSAMPDEALQIIQYTTDPPIPTEDKNKP